MDNIQIAKLKQLISRTDMSGNEKVEWLINFIDNITEQKDNHAYVLIKEYPGLPKEWKLGEIVKQIYCPNGYSSISYNIDYRIYIKNEEVENYPEFWKKI